MYAKATRVMNFNQARIISFRVINLLISLNNVVNVATFVAGFFIFKQEGTFKGRRSRILIKIIIITFKKF